jgi:hypothetical protein
MAFPQVEVTGLLCKSIGDGFCQREGNFAYAFKAATPLQYVRQVFVQKKLYACAI